MVDLSSAHGPDPIAIGVFLAYLAAHIGVTVWAARSGHVWWAIGVFLFPIIGDIAYAIYRGSTPKTGPAMRVTDWDVRVGDVCRTAHELRVKKSGDRIPRGAEVEVVGVDDEQGLLEVRFSNGLTLKMERPHLAFVRRGDGSFVPTSRERVAGRSEAETTDDIGQQIRQLAQLHDEGLITDEEFAAKKRRILGI